MIKLIDHNMVTDDAGYEFYVSLEEKGINRYYHFQVSDTEGKLVFEGFSSEVKDGNLEEGTNMFKIALTDFIIQTKMYVGSVMSDVQQLSNFTGKCS